MTREDKSGSRSWDLMFSQPLASSEVVIFSIKLLSFRWYLLPPLHLSREDGDSDSSETTERHRTSVPKWQECCFDIGRSWLQISSRKRIMLTEVFRGLYSQ
jgi:hypothetical protein